MRSLREEGSKEGKGDSGVVGRGEQDNNSNEETAATQWDGGDGSSNATGRKMWKGEDDST